MHRSMVGFHQDEEQHWVAELECGHCQHTRHDPPFFSRPWVVTEAGRHEHIGQNLDCVLCDRLQIPDNYAPYKRTPLFTTRTIPAGLLSRHSVKRGIWGMIHVEQGNLRYQIYEPLNREIVIESGQSAVILPEVFHKVVPMDTVEFWVEFWQKRNHAS